MPECRKGSKDLSEVMQTLRTSTLREMVHCPSDWNKEDMFTDREDSADKVKAFKMVHFIGESGAGCVLIISFSVRWLMSCT